MMVMVMSVVVTAITGPADEEQKREHATGDFSQLLQSLQSSAAQVGGEEHS